MPKKTHLENVADFHRRFGVPIHDRPRELEPADLLFRVAFMHEELNEFMLAYLQGDLVKQADALLDLEYVLHGTALWMGLGRLWDELHDEVHAANMRKAPAVTAAASAKNRGRGHRFDVIKPTGWVGPDLAVILRRRDVQPD